MEKSKFPFHPVPPERQQVPPVFFPGRPIPGMAQAPPGYCGAAGARAPGGGAPQAAAQGTGPGCADQNPSPPGNADPSGCAKGAAAAAAVQQERNQPSGQGRQESAEGCAACTKEEPRRRYAAEGPYPPAVCTQKNIRYAQLLRMDFASPQSELTATMQYVYQTWAAEPHSAELSQIFSGIGKTEMHHLHLLGKMILSLGGTPSYTYWNGGRNFVWTGAAVRYQNDPVEMLRADIAAERNAIAGYERRIAAIGDPAVTDLLQRIILDEKVHIQILEDALQQYGKKS